MLHYARETVAGRERAASGASGSAGGRRSPCCAPWPPARPRRQQPCDRAARQDDAETLGRHRRDRPPHRPGRGPGRRPERRRRRRREATLADEGANESRAAPSARAGARGREAHAASKDAKLAEGHRAGSRSCSRTGFARSSSAASSRRPTTWPTSSARSSAREFEVAAGRLGHRPAPPEEREARVAALGEARAARAGLHRLPERGHQPPGALRRRRPLRPLLEPHAPRAARGPRGPLRPAPPKASAFSPTTAPTTRSTASSSTFCCGSTRPSATPWASRCPCPWTPTA